MRVRHRNMKAYISEHKYQICTVISLLLITFACLWSIGLQERVRRVDDEIGYWGIAARMTGYNWRSVMESIPYYSFGYSILLVPLYFLYRLGVSMSFCYRIAILLNVIMLDATFFMALYTAEKWAPKVNKYYRMVCVLAITLYSNNIMQSNTAWPETYIYFLYWCILVLALRAFEHNKIKDIALMIVLSFYLFTVHMRTIAIPIAVIIAIILWILGKSKKSYKKLIRTGILVVAVILVVGIAVLILKEYVESAIYGIQSAEEAIDKVNTLSGNMSKLSYFTSIAGLKDLGMSFLGKVYYQGVATYLLTYLGFGLVLKYVYTNIRMIRKSAGQVKLQTMSYVGIIILFSTIGSLLVSALFKVNPIYSGIPNQNRADSVIYGRYTEFLVNVLMLFALLILGQIRKHAELIGGSLVLMAITAISVQYQWDILSFYQDITISNGVDTIEAFFEGGFQNTAYLAALYATGIFGCMCCISMREKKLSKNLARWLIICLLIIVFTKEGMTDAVNLVKSNKIKSVESVAELIRELPDVPVYCVGNFGTDIKILQWEIPDRSIQLITSSEVAQIMDEEAIVISPVDHVLIGQINSYMDFLYSSGTIALYANKDTYAGQVLIENISVARQMVDETVGQVELSGTVAESGILQPDGSVIFNQEKAEGFLTQKTGLTLLDGIYEFQITLEITDFNEGDIGYVMATSSKDTSINTTSIDREDIKRNGEIVVTVQADIADSAEPYIMVYNYGNCQMRVTDISYIQVESVTPRNAEEQDELARVLEVIEIENRKHRRIYYIDSDGSGICGEPALMWGKYSDYTEEERKIVQLPYYAVKYLENKEQCIFVLEKTGEYEQLQEFLTGFYNRYETRHFILYMQEQ